MVTQYAEADIIAWARTLRVNDEVAIYEGTDLKFTTTIKQLGDDGCVMVDTKHLYLGRPLAATFLENGVGCASAGKLCIRPTKDAIIQIGHLRVLDFSGAAGMLVKAIEYFNDHLGIVVSTEIRFDEANKGIAWPLVIWEGSVTPEVAHPATITPYRHHELKWTEMYRSKPLNA
jgi:hypothetical protein